MTKRWISAFAAVVAILAFAVPSTAGAAKATCSPGVLCPTGTLVALTGTDFTLTVTGLGPITCSTLNLTSTIVVNNGTTVEASGKNVNPPATGCQNGSNVIKYTEFNVTKLFTNDTSTNTVKKGTMSFTIKTDTGKVTCNFTGTNVAGTYDSGRDVFQFSESTGVSSDNCGTAKLDASFTVETIQSGVSTPVILD